MSRSIYLSVAVLLLRMDYRRAEREARRKLQCCLEQLPLNSHHFLRDIGLDELYDSHMDTGILMDKKVALRVGRLQRLIRGKCKY